VVATAAQGWDLLVQSTTLSFFITPYSTRNNCLPESWRVQMLTYTVHSPIYAITTTSPRTPTHTTQSRRRHDENRVPHGALGGQQHQRLPPPLAFCRHDGCPLPYHPHHGGYHPAGHHRAPRRGPRGHPRRGSEGGRQDPSPFHVL
jgi:hypothetical protein